MFDEEFQNVTKPEFHIYRTGAAEEVRDLITEEFIADYDDEAIEAIVDEAYEYVPGRGYRQSVGHDEFWGSVDKHMSLAKKRRERRERTEALGESVLYEDPCPLCGSHLS